MASITLPRITGQLLPANIVDAFGERVDLICGQKTAAGTATDGALYESVQAMSKTEIEGLFGVNSEITNRIFQFNVGNGGYSRLDVIAVEDAGAASAAGGIVAFTGTSATEDGTFRVSVADKFAYRVTIDVLKDDVPDDIGTALETALTALANVPATAVNTTGSVALTATNLGTVGNFYGIEVEGIVAGITATVTGFSGGATDPTLTSIFDVVSDEQRYTGIGWPESWVDEVDIAVSFLENRFNPENAILDGIAFMGKSGTFATVKAFADALNTQVLVVGGNNVSATSVKAGPALMQAADYSLSYFMGVRAKRQTPGAPISGEIISTAGRNDAVGGPHTASLPYFSTELKAATPAPLVEMYSKQEQKELAASGFTVFGTNPTKTAVIMSEVVTPYKTDSAGNENISFHFLNYLDTGSNCREILLKSARANFAQSRLSEGDVVAGYSIATAETIKAHLLGVFRLLASIVLLKKGVEIESYLSNNTTVTINGAIGAATVYAPLPIVTQFRSAIYTLQFVFDTTEGQQITF